MKNRIYILLGLLYAFPVFAGFGDRYPIRWGKVSPSEFNVLPAGRDSAAPAIVLCDFGHIEVTNRTFYSRHTRIKIINEDGLKYASVEIPFQTKNRHDEFTEFKARTMIMKNGKILTYKVQQGQIKDTKINDRWSSRTFTFPQAQPGAIIEFQYTLASLDFENLNNWYFQREIPTLWSEVRFEVPVPYVYLVTYINNRSLTTDEEADFGNKLQWLFDTRARKRTLELARNNELLYATPENRFKVWAMNDRKKKIIMRNLPGLSEVAGEQAVTDFYPHVRFDLFESSGNLPRSFRPLLLTTADDYDERGEWSLMFDRTAIPGYVHFKLKTWSEFNTNLLEQDRFGGYLRKNKGGINLIDSITRGSTDENSRLAAVFSYVLRNFRWNGEFSMNAGQKFEEFLRSGRGSSGEINLLLVNLLQRAGIKADPLLVRTNDLGAPETMYPVKNQFNHVIAVADINGTQVLLDATSGTTDLKMLNRRDIGTQGWIVRETNPGWIDIYSPDGLKPKTEGPMFKL
jgi:hypothetical protein